MKRAVLFFTLLSIAANAGPAAAHAKLEGGGARIGQPFTADIEVPHGCDGKPTTDVLVQIPDGFLNAKPVAAEGWTASVKTGPYSEPHKLDGAVFTEGVTEVSWSGGSLADAQTKTFAIEGVFASDLKPGAVFFPMVQLCPDGGEQAWIGTDADSNNPAPSVTLAR